MLVLLTGCSKSSLAIESEAKEEMHEETVDSVGRVLEENVAALLVQADYETFAAYTDQGETYINPAFDNDLKVRWKEFNDLHGKITDARLDGVERKGNDYAGHLVLTGEDGEQMRLNIVMTETCTPISTTMEAFSDDSKDTFGMKMSKAGMRTVTGLLVVFVVLVVLCLIISCFLLIGNAGNKKKAAVKKDASEEGTGPAAAAAKVTEAAPAASDDKELIAVIAAAIAASEGRPADGFVVRSIKRLGNNKW